MKNAIIGVQDLTKSATLDHFRQDWAMQHAVERAREIISEASRHLSAELKIITPEVPWPQIAAIGNLLRHEYQRSDPLAVWNIIIDHLPTVSKAIDRMILKENPAR